MVDERTGAIGLVMGSEGPYLQLRPPQGGKEWDVPPDALREPTAAETLRAKVRVANGRWGR
ncbi:hypothetical protein AB0M05_21625 [Streptomyces violaceusniger]